MIILLLFGFSLQSPCFNTSKGSQRLEFETSASGSEIGKALSYFGSGTPAAGGGGMHPPQKRGFQPPGSRACVHYWGSPRKSFHV